MSRDARPKKLCGGSRQPRRPVLIGILNCISSDNATLPVFCIPDVSAVKTTAFGARLGEPLLLHPFRHRRRMHRLPQPRRSADAHSSRCTGQIRASPPARASRPPAPLGRQRSRTSRRQRRRPPPGAPLARPHPRHPPVPLGRQHGRAAPPALPTLAGRASLARQHPNRPPAPLGGASRRPRARSRRARFSRAPAPAPPGRAPLRLGRLRRSGAPLSPARTHAATWAAERRGRLGRARVRESERGAPSARAAGPGAPLTSRTLKPPAPLGRPRRRASRRPPSRASPPDTARARRRPSCCRHAQLLLRRPARSHSKCVFSLCGTSPW